MSDSAGGSGAGRPQDRPQRPDRAPGERLPVFPLGTVLYPGLPLALLIFEDRYRAMMRDLLRLPQEERRFGVVAIREGYEVAGGVARGGAGGGGVAGRQSSYRVGCEAQLGTVERHSDGRFEVETVGARRFRVDAVHPGGEYLTADVVHLGEPLGADVAAAAERALAGFAGYRHVLSRHRGDDVMVGELPADPLALSYALAATAPLTLADRQAMLEVPDAQQRLHRLADLLAAELQALRAVPSLPATDVARTGWSPN